MAEVIEDLKRHNPELLEMAVSCAKSRNDRSRVTERVNDFDTAWFGI
jgi:hypothetical protein